MVIKIVEEPDIHLTSGELARYQKAYDDFNRYRSGPPITLEEFIRTRQHDEASSKGGKQSIRHQRE